MEIHGVAMQFILVSKTIFSTVFHKFVPLFSFCCLAVLLAIPKATHKPDDPWRHNTYLQ